MTGYQDSGPNNVHQVDMLYWTLILEVAMLSGHLINHVFSLASFSQNWTLIQELLSCYYTPAQRSWRGGILDSPCFGVDSNDYVILFEWHIFFFTFAFSEFDFDIMIEMTCNSFYLLFLFLYYFVTLEWIHLAFFV